MFARRLIIPLLFAVAAFAIATARADGPQDNDPTKVSPVPPIGIVIPEADAEEIKTGLTELQGIIKDIGKHDLLPDVEIFEKAVRYAVTYREVFDAKGGIAAVKKVLKDGIARAKLLKDGKSPWATQTGYVLRGYRSKIDGSAQPYGLFVPKEYEVNGDAKHRLDFWWHGRGATLTEVNFMAGQQGASGIISVPGQFILYPYGRFCNANKFAGEIDSIESLEHVGQHYRIDAKRLVARGFSMGGAACWQYAVHYPMVWCANAPGAGFSETPEFLKDYQKETLNPTWYEEKLWRMYNATDYAANIFNLPTVAYSGEIDSQRQAAVVMEKAMAKEGLKLVHIIGPKTGHGYEKEAKVEVNKQIDEIVAKGRNDDREKFRFTTFTLKYSDFGIGRISGLGRHWERARVDGDRKDGIWNLKTENVTALEITCPFRLKKPGGKEFKIVLDGQELPLEANGPNGAMQSCYRHSNDKWTHSGEMSATPVKTRELQGPIDDAFMDSFIMVKPSGTMMNAKANDWTVKEMKHAVDHWRQQFRGDAPIKKDTEITDDDIKNSNLILWGDPKTNAVLAKIVDKLPVKWDSKIMIIGNEKQVFPYFEFGGKAYGADTHVPVMIFPNPLNPRKYVVLNSGFTYREYDYLNNARQVPRLPDYAIVDITTPAGTQYPGKVVRAGFFGEKWELLPNDGK